MEQEEKTVSETANIVLFTLGKSSKNIRSQIDFIRKNISEFSWRFFSIFLLYDFGLTDETKFINFVSVYNKYFPKNMLQIFIICLIYF